MGNFFKELCSWSTEEGNHSRGNWSSKVDYLLSLLGMAIGLGNVWRFPYLCFVNGGGVFLIPYTVMMVLVNVPLFLLETSMGQFSSATFVKLLDVCPALRGVAFTALIITCIATSYYCVLIAYPLVFLWHCFTLQTLPWNTCHNYWNTRACRTADELQFYNENNRTTIDGDEEHEEFVESSVEFFLNEVLRISTDIRYLGGIVPSIAVANVIVWIVVFFSLFKGVKVLGKVVWFTALFPFLVLFVLLVRGLTLPGASDGIIIYLYPDFSKLLTIRVWSDAAVQGFFSLGAGWGSLHCLGSFSKFHNNTVQDAVLVPVVNALTSFVSGLVVFSVLGFMAHNVNKPVADLVLGGTDLAFIAYPEAIATMPGSHFWAFSFFIMIFFLGIDSCFVQVETVVVSLQDYFPIFRDRKSLVTFLVCTAIFGLSIVMCTRAGIYYLTLIDGYVVTLGIFCVGVGEMVIFCYFYGPGRLARDIQTMTGKTLNYFWIFNWLYSCPLLLSALLIIIILFNRGLLGYGDYIFPQEFQIASQVVTLLPILVIPVYWLYYMCSIKGSFQERLQAGHSPLSTWGPRDESHRERWTEYCAKLPTLWRQRYCSPTIPPPKWPEEIDTGLALLDGDDAKV
ncbi:Sodium:neurotransmitter symporter [Trinorchestia longiramus]|nr:Sodium:neurotransmitter symporter [Trinorchestia longiramus]